MRITAMLAVDDDPVVSAAMTRDLPGSARDAGTMPACLVRYLGTI